MRPTSAPSGNRRFRVSLSMRIGLLVVLAFTLVPLRVRAIDEVVTDCGSDAGLRSALNNIKASGEDGTVNFDCGAGPTTIVLTGGVLPSIGADVTIDGGGSISVSGANSARIFVVSGGTLRLHHIGLTNGFSDEDGGAIYNDGTLFVVDSFIQNSNASGSGGALVSFGPTTITNSTLKNNHAANGGALYLKWSAASATITDSRFYDNATTSTTDGWGGAILPWDGAAMEMEGGEFVNNTARSGGAIYNGFGNSTVQLTNVTLSKNTATAEDGGAINNINGRAVLDGITAFDNTATAGNGGAFANTGGNFTVVNGFLYGNRAGTDGGAVFSSSTASALTLYKVGIEGNIASGEGGGVRSRFGVLTLDSVTLTANQAELGGGLSTLSDRNILANVTIAFNEASKGGGLYAFDSDGKLFNVTMALGQVTGNDGGGNLYNIDSRLELKSVVLADSVGGGNCAGTDPESVRFSLSTDNTCTLNGPGNRTDTPAQLGILQDNGGGLRTMLPEATSPLIDGGQCIDGVGVDQRGVSRPNGAACDIGAVEVVPVIAQSEHVYLPVVIR